MRDLKNPEYYMKKLDITYEEAVEVIAFDKEAESIMKEEKKVEKANKPKVKKVGIVASDLDFLKDIINKNFTPEQLFQNKELAMLAHERFTARQTPSRLKKLVEEGFLKSTPGKGGKDYQRVK